MKGKAKFVRTDRNGVYKVFTKNFFWQRWKQLKNIDGAPIEFKSFKELGEITKIEAFGEITITFDKFQGLGKTE